jgi:uncharacterized protein
MSTGSISGNWDLWGPLRDLGLPDVDPAQVSKLDSVAAMGDLERIGHAVAEEVRLEHFGPFVMT